VTRTLRIALFTIFNLIVAGNLLAQPIPVDDLSDSSACSPGISCTLRGAILFSEGNGVPDTIVFDDSITGGTISLLTTLPPITEQLEIDATSNANYAGSPLFFIDGSGVTGNGLEFISGSDNSRVKGLAIGGFSAGNAIQISDTSGVRIESSWIGTDTTGTAPHPNVIGVAVFNSSDVIIGGSDVGKRNVIVNNTASGIDLSSTNSCKVSANFIGISADTNTIGANFTGIS
jgi:hypothetical protein